MEGPIAPPPPLVGAPRQRRRTHILLCTEWELPRCLEQAALRYGLLPQSSQSLVPSPSLGNPTSACGTRLGPTWRMRPPPPHAHGLGDEEVMDTGAVGMLPYPIAALPVGGRPGTAVDAVLGAPLLSLLLAQLAPELARASFLLSFISQADCSPTNDEPEDRPGQYSAARTSAPPVPLAPAHSQLPHDAVARQPPLQPPAIAPRPRHGSSAASREQLVTASRGTTAFFPALPLGKELRLSPARHRLRRAPGRGCSAPNAGQCP